MDFNGRSPLFAPGDPVAVLGLGVSGCAAARLIHSLGGEVYASDVAAGPSEVSAAESLAAGGIVAEAGRHDLGRILSARLVVTSPGIAPATEVRREVAAAGVPTVAETEVAYRALASRVIAVTGTNGKTTATRLCADLLAQSGLSSVAAGNIGRPLSEVPLMDEQPDWVVVELSSFQLAGLSAFRPEIGVFLNLAPDHLDWYPDIESYYRDKARFFANADADSRWVLNGDDREVLAMAGAAAGRRYLATMEMGEWPGAYVNGAGDLVQRLEGGGAEKRWISGADLRLAGAHNVKNALLAGLAAALAGCDARSIRTGLASFTGLPHRLQHVGEFGGVTWINDSKGTNIFATQAALEAFPRPLVVLLGGKHKGESFARLLPALAERARAVIAYGQAAPAIARELGEAAPVEVAADIPDLVRRAREAAEPGDVALFSPACSSYDQFPDYRERGRAFEKCVLGMHGEPAGGTGAGGAGASS